MSQLSNLKNIGKETAIWLEEIGIQNLEDIEDLGVIDVYLRLKEKRPDVNRTALWALQGALVNLAYNRLPQEMKDDLLKQLNNRDR